MAELEDAAAELRIAVDRTESGDPLVVVAGDLDMSNAEALGSRVSDVLAEHPERLVFDLGELRFMDSAGIAVLIRALARVGTVEVRSASPAVRRVLEVTGLSEAMALR